MAGFSIHFVGIIGGEVSEDGVQHSPDGPNSDNRLEKDIPAMKPKRWFS
jgi:hypothetical protein